MGCRCYEKMRRNNVIQAVEGAGRRFREAKNVI